MGETAESLWQGTWRQPGGFTEGSSIFQGAFDRDCGRVWRLVEALPLNGAGGAGWEDGAGGGAGCAGMGDWSMIKCDVCYCVFYH